MKDVPVFGRVQYRATNYQSSAWEKAVAEGGLFWLKRGLNSDNLLFIGKIYQRSGFIAGRKLNAKRFTLFY